MGDAISRVTRALCREVVSLLPIGAGMMLIGTFTGMVADYFIGDEEIIERMTAFDAKLDRIEKKLDRIEKKLDRIEKKLDRLLARGDDGA